VTNGSIMNISVDIQPGKGRVLVETKPLMGIVFQDAANTAVFVARNRTGVDTSGSDILFSIEADKQISSVDGPSAGALMTLIAISALDNRKINPSVTLTGTIAEDGHIGAIGGALEKAQAAKENGLSLFLLPLDNQALTIYTEQTVNYGGFQLVEQVPKTVPAKEYIEKNAGINVTYVNSIDDVLADALQ
jgi:predicted S18 family serine protease